ncbi:MAG: dihydroorotase, partial [Synergistaceae bacterium]|nr:dihydroorotase [Synergistaceae bacterium]
MKNLIVKNVRIVDAQTDIIGQVEVRDGLFYEIRGGSQNPEPTDAHEVSVIDGGGGKKILMPAFTDLHAHFREPGFTDKEDIESG